MKLFDPAYQQTPAIHPPLCYNTFEIRPIQREICEKHNKRLMDELDFTIINALKANGRRPFTDIAQEVGVSEGTVRNRVGRLVEDQILHIVGLVDPGSMGFDAPAMIGVSVSEGDIEETAHQLAAFDEVSYLIMVSGEFDLIMEVMCRDREHLADFLNHKIRKVPGVGRTQTFMTLRTFKLAYGSQPIKDPYPASDL